MHMVSLEAPQARQGQGLDGHADITRAGPHLAARAAPVHASECLPWVARLVPPVRSRYRVRGLQPWGPAKKTWNGREYRTLHFGLSSQFCSECPPTQCHPCLRTDVARGPEKAFRRACGVVARLADPSLRGARAQESRKAGHVCERTSQFVRHRTILSATRTTRPQSKDGRAQCVRNHGTSGSGLSRLYPFDREKFEKKAPVKADGPSKKPDPESKDKLDIKRPAKAWLFLFIVEFQ